MQRPVIVSMLIRTRMSSICLQIGILLVCSWSLWGVSFNPSDLNARSKLRNPNSFEMVYFWCPIYTTEELKIQLLMILVLNFSTLRPVSYDRKEEKHCRANSCFTCVSVSANGPFLLSNIYFFSQEMQLRSLVWVCSVVVVSAVGSFTFSVSVPAFLIMPIIILHQRSLQAE